MPATLEPVVVTYDAGAVLLILSVYPGWKVGRAELERCFRTELEHGDFELINHLLAKLDQRLVARVEPSETKADDRSQEPDRRHGIPVLIADEAGQSRRQESRRSEEIVEHAGALLGVVGEPPPCMLLDLFQAVALVAIRPRNS